MDSTGDTHLEAPQQDHKTKNDVLVNPTKVKNEVIQPMPEGPKPLYRYIRLQLSNIQMVSCQTVINIHHNITVMEAHHETHLSNLRKMFRNCHHLLEVEEATRMDENKKQEDHAMKKLEEKTLELVHLMEQIQSAKTKDQLNVIEEKLKTLERPHENLGLGDPPVQLRIWKQMMHMVKPVPELIQFDPQSAHLNLAMSPDFKQVRFEPTPQIKVTSLCFEPGLYVLGTPGFKSGRHYWEVNVGNKSNWIIGVVKESVERKGIWELNSTNGYWVLRKQGDNVYYSIGNICERLSYNFSPMRIGVCLDLLSSRLVFYDASTTDVIHQLSLGFVRETVLPFFCPGVPMREDDWCPLTICA